MPGAPECLTDSSQVEEVMALYQAPLLRYACRVLNDPAGAQDVVQDAFIRFCRTRPDTFSSEAERKSWLYRVVHNRAVDMIRKESRLKVLHEKQADVLSDQQGRPTLNREEAMLEVQQQMNALKEDERQAVILRLQEGLSYREIASVMELPEGTVGRLLHDAVSKLRDLLKQSGVIA